MVRGVFTHVPVTHSSSVQASLSLQAASKAQSPVLNCKHQLTSVPSSLGKLSVTITFQKPLGSSPSNAASSSAGIMATFPERLQPLKLSNPSSSKVAIISGSKPQFSIYKTTEVPEGLVIKMLKSPM